MLEEERKFEVDEAFTVPDLSGCAPKGGRVLPLAPATLRATYYDTPDRRLARAGVSLRHRKGEAPAKAWTVKLPTDRLGSDRLGSDRPGPHRPGPDRPGPDRPGPDRPGPDRPGSDRPGSTAAPNVRHEFHRPGGPESIPDELAGLVTAYHRGAPLAPAAVVRTARRAYEVRDADDRVLAEIADDTVSVLEGHRVTLSFREIEVERIEGDTKLLDRVGKLLTKAGAKGGSFVPKHVRALGAAAQAPADLPGPDAMRDKPTAAQVVSAALRKDIGRVFAHDPFVRLRQPLPDGDTPVHQMRVGIRRLRSDLRTFKRLLDPDWTTGLRGELKWLADALGAARDAEVLRARLQKTAHADPIAPVDEASVARIDAALAARHEATLSALDQAMTGDRYTKLLDVLVKAAREPRLAKAASRKATRALPKIVAKPWRKLADSAGDLTDDASDADWHQVRIRGKRARYAADAAAGALGGGAAKLAKALAGVQEHLGEHQDAAVAADTWLEIASRMPDDHALAVTAGRLYERERASVRRARANFPAAWAKASSRGWRIG
jgi:CHAD domain-containing protein